METTFTTLRLNSWKEYKEFVDGLSENWVFRGQSDAHWGLQNAIERTEFITFYKGIEKDFLFEFQRGARNYLNKDETPEHLIEWLALMQHHGAPTRLLDFSKSPYIGAYFAYEEGEFYNGEDVSIWAINVHYLKLKAIEVLKNTLENELSENQNLINENIFEKIFFNNNIRLVFPAEPFRMNRRYSLQQSIFISTGISEEPFMKQLDFLKDDIQKMVVKIVVPAKFQKEVLRDLQRMNLHRASLFPDLDGYAASMRLRYNSMKSPQERHSNQLSTSKIRKDQLMP
jgi:hypothetical protein